MHGTSTSAIQTVGSCHHISTSPIQEGDAANPRNQFLSHTFRFSDDLNPRYQRSWYTHHLPIHSNCNLHTVHTKLPSMSSGLEKQNPKPGCLLILYSSVQCSASWCMELDSFLPSFLPSPTILLANVHPVLSCSCRPSRALPSQRNLTTSRKIYKLNLQRS
jgi:hypothetical protein